MAQADEPQIIALGGGGFTMEPENPALDRYMLECARRSRPQVCFLPTASGDSHSYVEKFRAAFGGFECEPSHLSLFRPHTADLRSFLLAQDVVYVGGGNTYNLLLLWRAWGLDAILREAWESGTLLAGLSAGALCWFEDGVTDSFTGLAPLKCLGFLPGSHCPHYDGEPGRRPTYHRLIGEGSLSSGYAADDGAALHFVGRTLARVVASRPNARAYRVERAEDGSIRETALETTCLGEAPPARPTPELSITDAVEGDWSWILAAHVQTGLESLAPARRPGVSAEALEERLAAQLSELRSPAGPAFAALVARAPDGQYAGCALVEETSSRFTGERVACVTLLFVESEWRRRGVGRLLMGRAEEWAREQALGRIGMNVAAHNAAARVLYEQAGYTPEMVRMGKGLGE